MSSKETIKKFTSQLKTRWKLASSIVAFVIFLFLGLLGFIIYIFDGENIKVDPDNNGNTIVQLESKALIVKESDTVTVKRSDDEIQVEDEFEVYAGDEITTDSTGVAYIIFSDNSSITIDSNSKISIQSFDSNSQKGLNIKVKQLFGRTWSRVENVFGKSEFEVETPNTIAAVRGTEFGCDVLSEDDTKCYAIEHDISMFLKNSEFLDFIWTLKEGNWYRNTEEITSQIQTVDQLDPFIDDLALPEEFWTNFNKCLSENIEGMDKSLIDYLNEEKLGCSEEGVVEESTPTPPPAPIPLPTVSGVNINVDPNATSLTCSWSGTEANSYQVFVGTSPNSPDVYSWLDVNATTHTFYNPNLVSGFRYYCNALAINSAGISSVVSSAPYLHDRSAITMNDATSSPWDDYDYYVSDNITLNGNFSGMNANQVQIRYTVRQSGSTPALYLDYSSNWTTTPTWFYGTFTDLGGGNMRFVATPVLPNAVYMVFNYEIYSDHFNGRVYRTQTSRSTYSY